MCRRGGFCGALPFPQARVCASEGVDLRAAQGEQRLAHVLDLLLSGAMNASAGVAQHRAACLTLGVQKLSLACTVCAFGLSAHECDETLSCAMLR